MESRASSTITVVALRYLRRHLHHGLSRYPVGTRNSSSVPTAAAIRGQAREECCYFEVDVPRMESAEKSTMVDPTAGLRILSPSKLRCGHEWGNKVLHEGGIYQGVKQTLSVQEPFFIPLHCRQKPATEDDFCSRFLQWKRYEQLSHSLDPINSLPTEEMGGEAVEATGRLGDVQNLNSVSRPCGSNLLSCRPLSILDKEPRALMVTIPLEASSVKKKRKKKMNKHKQRKLRRRDRHRN